MTLTRFLAPIGLCLALSGCASTAINTTGAAPTSPLCEPGAGKPSALALWGPRWRANQKDVPDREAAAQRGIERYFKESGCYARVEVRRLPAASAAAWPADAELLALAAAGVPTPDRVLSIAVRELGPVVRLGLPKIVAGGTEVVVEVKVLDVRSGAPLADQKTHWQHGGPFYLKGVKTLEQDMNAALRGAIGNAAQTQ